MSLSAHEYLQHILDETTFIQRRSRKLTRAKFMRDETLRRAFVRSIEVIGEATKQIPDEFRQQYPQIDWRAMAGMRDHLIHGYFGIDYDIVWDVVKNKLPSLKTQINNILTGEID